MKVTPITDRRTRSPKRTGHAHPDHAQAGQYCGSIPVVADFRRRCRTRMEFVVSNHIKVHPTALVQYDSPKDKDAKRTIAELTRGYTDNPILRISIWLIMSSP
jgi:hypothetical protein